MARSLKTIETLYIHARMPSWTSLFCLAALLPIVLRHNEPILGIIRPVGRAREAIASDSETAKLEDFFVLQANFLQDPSRSMIVYQGCRLDALQLEVLKAVAQAGPRAFRRQAFAPVSPGEGIEHFNV